MKAGMCWWAVTCTTALMLAFAAPFAIADDVTDAKVVCNNCSSAVVKVLVVIKANDGSESFEQKLETAGTVIDPSGLTVVSLSTVDPSNEPDFDEENISMEVTGVKIRVSDGKEIASELVLRDKDLDLAFIRPVQKLETPLASIDLKNAANVDLLDEIVVLTRLGKIADRTSSVCMERVQAVVERPRKFYVVSLTSMGEELGSPVFTTGGKVVGIVVTRRMPGKFEEYGQSSLPIVMSAEDVASVADQALTQAPKEVKKVEEKPAANQSSEASAKTEKSSTTKRVK